MSLQQLSPLIFVLLSYTLKNSQSICYFRVFCVGFRINGLLETARTERETLFFNINVAFASLKAMAQIIGRGSPRDLIMGTLKLLVNLLQYLVTCIQNTGLPVECDPVRRYSRQYFSILYFKASPSPFPERQKFPRRRGHLYTTVKRPDFIAATFGRI